jgi:acyl-CoA synthetase (NDP forming)
LSSPDIFPRVKSIAAIASSSRRRAATFAVQVEIDKMQGNIEHAIHQQAEEVAAMKAYTKAMQAAAEDDVAALVVHRDGYLATVEGEQERPARARRASSEEVDAALTAKLDALEKRIKRGG